MAAWSVTNIRNEFIAVPKTINDTFRGTLFAIDFYKSTNIGGSLNATITMDQQPSCFYYHKNLLFIGASQPAPVINILDGHLFIKLAKIELTDVPMAMTAVEKPYGNEFNLLIAVQSCGMVSVFKMGHH